MGERRRNWGWVPGDAVAAGVTEPTGIQVVPFTAQLATTSPLGRITMAGFIREGTGVREMPMRWLGAYGLVYVLDGGGRYRDGSGLETSIRAGDLILLFPEIPHTYGPAAGDRWTELYFVFTGPVFDLWREAGLLDADWPLRHLQPIDVWQAKFESVLGAPRQLGYAPPLIEVCRLQAVLGEALLSHAPGRSGSGVLSDAEWTARACALLESDLDQDLDLASIADTLGMSYDGFRKRFTRATGTPPARWRAAKIIERACVLMHESALSDRQIAHALGFCDAAHFSRRFKLLTGRTPRDFRRSVPASRQRLDAMRQGREAIT